jgi:hypothetical protein
MAVKYEIEVIIDADGQVHMTTHGLKGAECEVETKSIEHALGKVSKRTRTREYYEQTTSATRHVKKN